MKMSSVPKFIFSLMLRRYIFSSLALSFVVYCISGTIFDIYSNNIDNYFDRIANYVYLYCLSWLFPYIIIFFGLVSDEWGVGFHYSMPVAVLLIILAIVTFKYAPSQYRFFYLFPIILALVINGTISAGANFP